MEADYDVVILGAGAAGLSAGLYTTRAMLKTVLLEQIGPGGQLLITDEIENYPGFPEGVKGQELAAMMERQTARFGAETEYTQNKQHVGQKHLADCAGNYPSESHGKSFLSAD